MNELETNNSSVIFQCKKWKIRTCQAKSSHHRHVVCLNQPQKQPHLKKLKIHNTMVYSEKLYEVKISIELSYSHYNL